MNPNPKLKAQQIWWDAIIPELIELVLYRGYKLKDLAEHFGRTVAAISSALHNRNISLNSLRYSFAQSIVNEY